MPCRIFRGRAAGGHRNTVIAITSEPNPLAATDLSQVFETSACRLRRELVPARDSLAKLLKSTTTRGDMSRAPEGLNRPVRVASKMKRTWCQSARPTVYEPMASREFLREAVKVKTLDSYGSNAANGTPERKSPRCREYPLTSRVL